MIVDYSKLFHTQPAMLSAATGRTVVEVQKNVARQFSALTYEVNKRTRHSKHPVQMIVGDLPIEELSAKKSRSSSWKSLDMCEKYKILKAFLEDNQVSDVETADLVKALKRGTLQVEYDKSNKTISKASLPDALAVQE